MHRTPSSAPSRLRVARPLATFAAMAALATTLACGSGGGDGGSDDATVLPPAGALRGLAVASSDLTTWDIGRGAAPAASTAALAESGLVPSERFQRAVPEATVEVDGATGTTTTSSDGTFFVSGLAAGDHVLRLRKTVDGNLLDASVPVRLSNESGTALLVELSANGFRVIQRYRDGGRTVERILAPNGSTRSTSDAALTAYALPGGATYTDANGDGAPDGCAVTGSDAAAPPPPSAVPDEPTTEPAPPPIPRPQPCTIGPVTRIELQIYLPGPTFVVGQTAYVAATGFDASGNAQDVTQIVTWESSNPAVASVDGWGAVTGRAPGKTRLRAELGTIESDDVEVRVEPRPPLTALFVQNLDCYFLPVVGVPTPPPGAVDTPGPETGGGSDGSSGGGSGGSGGVPVPPADDLFFPYPCSSVVEVGATRHYAATGQFGDTYYEDVTGQVTWDVSPGSVGTLGTDGLFTAVAAGDASITARLSGVTSDATPIRVVTEPTLISVDVYTDFPLPVPLAETPKPDSTGSSGEGSASGGSTTPTPPLPGTEPSPVSPDILPCAGEDCLPYAQTVLMGDTIQFHAVARYDTGLTRDVTGEVQWSSSAALVGLVGPAGKMTALLPGTTDIRASFAGVTSAAVTIQVVKQATAQGLFIYAEGPSFIAKKGETTYFHATAYYDVTGLVRDVTGEVTWRSSDPKTASFASPGALVGKSAGFVDVTASLGSLTSSPVRLEVWQTSNLNYCDPNAVNGSTWSDDLNRVTLETDCASYARGATVTMRYTIDEVRPNPAPLIDPCLDLFVYRGETLVRTVREEGCGQAIVPEPAAAPADAALYQTLAFWDQRDERGALVEPGDYRIVGVFYIYYDPVIEVGIEVR